MADKKEEATHQDQETTKPDKGKMDDLSDKELEKASGGYKTHIQD